MAVRFSIMPITPIMQTAGPVLPSIPSSHVTLSGGCTATLTAHQLASLKGAMACGYRVDLLAARLNNGTDRLAVLFGERHTHRKKGALAGQGVVRAFSRRAVEEEQFGGIENPFNIAEGFLRGEFYGSLIYATFLAAPPPELADKTRKFVRAEMEKAEFGSGLRLMMRERGYSRSVDLSPEGLRTFLEGSDSLFMDGSPAVYLEKGLQEPVWSQLPLQRVAVAAAGALAVVLGAAYTQTLLAFLGFIVTVYGLRPFLAWNEYVKSDKYMIDYRNRNMAINLATEVMREECEDPLLSILGRAHNPGLSELLIKHYDFRRIPIP